MARTRTRRPRRAGGLTAVVTAAVFSAVTRPAHAVPEGTVTGAVGPGAAALHLARHPGALPVQMAKALVTGAGPGKVTAAGPGSPDRPPRVPRP